MRNIVFCQGRMNPPTRGHAMLINRVRKLAKAHRANPVVFIIDGLRTGKDKSNNPLTGEERIALLKSLYGDVTFIQVSSAYESLEVIDVMGYKPLMLVTGSDRAQPYTKMVRSYFGDVEVQALMRDAASTGIDGISATKARTAVRENDFTTFSHTIIKMKHTAMVEVFNALRLRL